MVPSDWLTTPIFTIKPIPGRPPVVIGFKNREWRFGVASPTGEASRPATLDHAAVLFTVLGVYQAEGQLLTPDPLGVSISLKEIARRVSTYQTSLVRRAILQKLEDLRHIWVEYDHPVVVLKDGRPMMRNGQPICQMATDTFALLSDYATRKLWAAADQPQIDHSGKDYIDLEVWQQQNGIDPEDPKNQLALPTSKPDGRKVHFVLKRVVLSREFLVLAREITRWIHVRLSEFRSLRSDIARAIYLYIPSRAAHRNADNPWRISITKLLTQIGVTVPPYASDRRQIFVQNGSPCLGTEIDGRLSRSIVAQLDSKPMAGGVFRCRIEKNAAGTDYLFVCWSEDANRKTPHDFKVYDDAIVRTDSEKPSKLLAAWIAAGRDRAEYLRRVSPPPELESHEAEWLTDAQIDTQSTALFFRMAKALLGEVQFHSLLKEAVQESAAESPTGLLISRVLKAVANPPKSEPAAPPPAQPLPSTD